MATITNTALVDDTDPSGETSADETVSFGLDGVAYEIDLSAKNASQLRGALGDWTQFARKASISPKVRRDSTRSARDRRNSAEVRAWARSQGIEVSERGRIPQEITDKYNAAH